MRPANLSYTVYFWRPTMSQIGKRTIRGRCEQEGEATGTQVSPPRGSVGGPKPLGEI